ncbi:MAG TPA: ABC transporter substrate-binding protein [Candidatus Limnocylindrales bacterium]|nr:ABC transporter substrate-binding protein [Candidatus Limnocylindrales bacterium]
MATQRFTVWILAASFALWVTENSAAAQIKSIIVGEGVRGAMYMPAYIAEEKGFFKRRELDSKIVTFSRSNDINALVSGDIQFDQTSPDKVIHSALGGFPVRMVMATTRGLNLALAVQPAIKSAADLKGKSVAVTSFSGLPYTGLLLCLKELAMSKDQVVPLNIGGKSARFEALLHGRVAAAILDPPYTTMATKAGYKLLVDLAPLDVPYLRNVVAVSQKALREDSATIARFVEALSEGMRYYRDQTNREESLRILAKYLRVPLETNRAMLEEGYETYRDMLLRKPYADPGAMKILLEVIGDSNPKARNLNLASLIDSSFVERLDRQGSFGN